MQENWDYRHFTINDMYLTVSIMYYTLYIYIYVLLTTYYIDIHTKILFLGLVHTRPYGDVYMDTYGSSCNVPGCQ